MSNPWIGTWAADVEREEREEAAAAAAGAVSSGGLQNFPSLKEAASTKPKKKKMSLNAFHTEIPSGGARLAEHKGLTPDEMRHLPTGPRERSSEEIQHGRFGGFSNYGRTGAMPVARTREREDARDDGWGGGRGRRYGGRDDDRRASSRASDNDLPSRADEVDSWATMKKNLPVIDSARPGRYGSLGSGGSQADEVDNWAIGKKQIPPPTSSSTFGSGFRGSSELEADRWSRGSGGFSGDTVREPVRERPRLVLDPPKANAVANEQPSKNDKPNPFGAARPREEVLAEKGLDWKKIDMDTMKSSSHSSRPTSSHSSRPSSAHSNKSDVLQQYGSSENVFIKPRPKVNPFGDAKPREVLLEERGQDWRKIDLELEHRAVERPETQEEKLLKAEISHLKEELQRENSVEESVENQLLDAISEKEKALENLIHDLDDKIRFGQKAVDRPGSGGGRIPGMAERPPSQSSSVDESRNVEFVGRPTSRGNPDHWTQSNDEKRPFNPSRERGFVGNRDFDRPRSRGGW